RNEVRVSTELDDQGRIVISIADTGSGMPPEVQRRLFTPFYSTKPPGSGTGLGLAICHRIVSSLGGDISFESQLGKGTRFVVALPSAEGEVSPRSHGSNSRTSFSNPARRSRVLVIDDDQAVGALVRRALLNDYDVVVVNSAEHALDMLQRGEQFDVVLCDVMMPQMTGAEFYEAVLRANLSIENRIIFMTGGAFTANAREFLDRVNLPFLEKPFDLSTLRELVASKL
ncbi:MAG TPA: ATP-binding protein, partial [Polyangiaceae bacterium]|nr:ATP-binding protein [Polyangiaceae bacterium]